MTKLQRQAPRGRNGVKVSLGGVTVTVTRPDAAQVKRNVEQGAMALERTRETLLRSGVRLYPKKGVPVYFADKEPGVFLRRLNGKIERGVLENGKFKVIA